MFEKIKKIDAHVHYRDWDEAYKETIRGGSEKAATQGIMAVGDMPNTKPSILWEDNVRERLKLAIQEKPLVKYFLWVGLTSRKDQIKEAVRLVKEIPQVIGLKLYAGPTTGELGVFDEREQEKIYRILADLKYQGVLAAHCEKKTELKTELWNPDKPWTYGKARPIKAEVEAVKSQIRLARISNFRGHLHICHASCRRTLNLVQMARKNGLQISCEVTPHHALLSEEEMKKPDGLKFKVNPPLRPLMIVEELRLALIRLAKRKVNWLWIATDYAPHTVDEKLKPDGPSGIADYSLYGQLLNWLREKGLSPGEIEQLTFHNIVKTFGEKFKIRPR